MGSSSGGGGGPSSDELLDEIGRSAGVGAWQLDVASGRGTWTAEVARIHELDPASPISVELGLSFYAGESRARLERALRDAIELGRPYTLDLELRTPAGHRKWVRAIGRPVQVDGRVVQVRGTLQDITDLRRAEDARRHGDELLRLFVESSPGAVAMFDRDLRYLAVSRRFAADLRVPTQDLIGRGHYDVFPEISERWRAIHRRCLAGATERCTDDEFPRADGTMDWVTWEIRPWHDADGEIGGIVLFSEVVTERKRAELALSASEHRFRTIFEHSPLGVGETDLATGRFLRVNAKLCAILGRSRDELLALSPPDITHPDDRTPADDLPAGRREKRYLRPDGSIVWVRVALSRDDDAGTVIGVVEDVTELRAADLALRAGEERTRVMLDTVPVGIALVARGSGRIASANARLGAMLGYTCEELCGSSIMDLTHPEDRARAGEVLARVRGGGVGTEEMEQRYLRKDGGVVWAHVTVTSIGDAVGDPTSTVVTIDDITERRRAEATSRLQTTALQAAANGIVITDAAGIVEWVNDAFTSLSGYGAADVIGRKIGLQKSGLQDPDFYRDLWQTILAGRVWHGELINARKDGSLYDEDQTITPVRDADGAISHFISIKQDVTERKRADAVVRESEARLRAALVGLPIPIVLADVDRGAVEYNAAFTECFGYTIDDAPTISAFMATVFPDPEVLARARSTWSPDLAAAIQSGDATPARLYPITRKDGALREVELVGRMVSGILVGVFQDVTEQRRAAAALAESELRQRLALETGGLAIWRHDLVTGQVELDARARALFGLDRPVVTTAALFARLHPDDAITAGQVAQAFAEGDGRAVRRVLGPAGETRWVSSQMSVQFEGEGAARRPVVATVIGHDITTERRALDALRASEERYRNLVDSVEDIVFALDPDGVITFVNRAVASYGYRVEDCVGRPFVDFVDPDDRARARELNQRRLAGDLGGAAEYRLRDAAGRVRHVRITTRRAADGHGLAGIAVDVTAQRRTEEQLRAAQKLEAIGRLAGGVAHDFNNLLTVILSYAELAQASLRVEDPLRQDLEEIIGATTRAAGLTRQLLAFSRRQVLQPEAVDPDELVGALGRMLHRLIGEDIELELRPSRRASTIMVDRGQMEQVVMNLVVNARDAMPDGGHMTIATEAIELDEAAAAPLELPPGPYVLLSVSDDGVGMDAVTQLRIFEPFFTTKEQGKGTGLGLSTVYGIVKQSRGGIAVESTLGAGSTFRIYLPADAIVDAPAPAPHRPGSARGHETILVIEDEAALRAAVVRVLTSAGYHTLVAATPSEALRLAAVHGRSIRLIFTDVVMPEMNGRELATRLAPLCPGARILYTSGYTDDALLRSGVLGEEFLPKPYDPATLAGRIRSLLDAGPR